MPIQAEAPPAEQTNPYAPPGPQPLLFDQFQGINTSTTRPGVDDKQMYWADGWMPIGPYQLRTMPGAGPSIFTAPNGTTIRFFDFSNLGAEPIAILIMSDGSIQQARTDTGTQIQIAPPGTVVTPERANVGISQWGSQYVIFVAAQTNGYWLWDGTFLYTAGTLAPNVNIQNNGSGYTSAPTITAYGGRGSGAAFQATVNGGLVTGISITSIGQGYQVNDVVALAFSGGGSAGSTAVLTPFVANGSLSTISITNPGAGYTSLATAAALGGGGIGVSIALTVSSGTISAVSLVQHGAGYSSAPTIIVTDASNPVAQATANLMPFGVSGTAIETYSSRVWVSSGAEVSFTAPGSLTDFATSDGGGNFTSTDSFLRVGFVQLRQTNGFLYLIGDSSINYISGVTTTGTPPTTTFSNQNADPEVGTPYPATVDVFGRNIMMANAVGVHISYGAAVTKISEALDGVYNTAYNFNGEVLSSAKAIVFGKKIWMVLLPYVDPVTQEAERALFMWNGKLWWASDQDMELLFVQHQEINSVLTAWGTDGTDLRPLFQTPSTGFEKHVRSKLWMEPGGYQFIKATSRLWAIFEFYESTQQTVEIDIDSEIGSNTYSFTSPIVTILVKNASHVTIPCKNASLVTIPVKSVFSGTWVVGPAAVGQQGVLTGMTIRTSAADISLISAMITDEIVAYRG